MEGKKGMYSFKTFEKGELHCYSAPFDTKEEAFTWYFKHGKWLEREFDRELYFVTK